MSAAPIPQPPRRPKHDICKVPLSYFTEQLEIMNPAERACFGLVLNMTIGMAAVNGKAQTWARIRDEQFVEIAVCVEKQYVMDRVETLILRGVILRKFLDGDPKRPLYSIHPNLAAETRGDKIRGRCKECKSVGEFPTRFIPMPRSFFSKLPLSLKNAGFLVTAIVARYSHEGAWTAADGLIPKWVDLDRNDFERDAGIGPAEITAGIKEAVGIGAIEIIRETGKASRYRTLPENWPNLGKKKLRLVTPPKRESKEPETDNPKQSIEKPAKIPVPPTIESPVYRYAFCPTCQHVVELEPIPDDLHIPEVLPAENQAPKQPPRARAGPEKRPVDKQQAGWDWLKEKYTKQTILKA